MKNISINRKGFTLFEILVTVGIIWVLSTFVVTPACDQYKKSASQYKNNKDYNKNTVCEKAKEAYKKAHLEFYKFNKYEEAKMWKYLDKLESQGVPVDDISASQLAKRDPKYAKHLKKKTTIHDKHQKQKDQYFKICKTKKDLTWKQIIKEWKSQGLLP